MHRAERPAVAVLDLADVPRPGGVSGRRDEKPVGVKIDEAPEFLVLISQARRTRRHYNGPSA